MRCCPVLTLNAEQLLHCRAQFSARLALLLLTGMNSLAGRQDWWYSVLIWLPPLTEYTVIR